MSAIKFLETSADWLNIQVKETLLEIMKLMKQFKAGYYSALA